MLTLDTIDITAKRVVMRLDLNLPMREGKITNLKRLHAVVPTIKHALERRAGIIILSHLGRPEEGQPDAALSLKPVADALAEHLACPVRFETDYLSGVNCEPGDVVLCENVRFNVGEKAASTTLAKQYAALGDVFVMDAFACAHRDHASTASAIQHAPIACAGLLLSAEINALESALDNPQHPFVAIVGGAKVSSKLGVLKGLLEKVDTLILGGGLANTLLAATGQPVGQSLYEKELIPEVDALLHYAEENGKSILQPLDVVVANRFSADASAHTKPVSEVADNELILDIGPLTINAYQACISKAAALLWNGPVGVFEFPAFASGTRAISEAIANAPGFTLAGGGETIAAIDAFIQATRINYVSTGGGAFLEYLEGRPLPAIERLKTVAKGKVAC